MVWPAYRWWLPQQEVLSSCLVLRPSTSTYRVNTQDLRHDSHHWPHSPFTQQITLCFLYCFSGLWAFCLAVLLLTYIVATKMGSYHELNPWDIIHILGFITPVFLPVCLMMMAGLAIFQAWIWVWVVIGKCVIFIQIMHRVRQFEFQCKCTVMRRSFKNVISECSVFFFAFTDYFAIIHSVNCATFI